MEAANAKRLVNTALSFLGSAVNETVEITGLSNREFLEKYAQPGRVGLSCGATLIDKAIVRAERHLSPAGEWSLWSHAFVFQGSRHDGQHWVIESDLQINRRHIRLGVQENRISKYFDSEFYTTLAVLDFNLPEATVTNLLSEALELVAQRERYSLRELLGTLIALKRPELRGKENLLSRERSMYCSAFVQHLFQKAGIELTPGVHGKNTTPEDISQTAVPHRTYLLKRDPTPHRISAIKNRLRQKMRSRVDRIKSVRQK